MRYTILILLIMGTSMARWQWTPFFDGTSFDGWFIEGDKSYWSIHTADSAIEGSSTQSTPYTMVFTDREFDKLTVKYQIRLMAGCSGFFFRAQNLSSGALVRGMQVEAKFRSNQIAEAGSLYCHDCGSNSGWRVQHTDGYSKAITNPNGEYQDYMISVDDTHVYVNVNGFQATGETDQAILNTGAKRAYSYGTTSQINTPGKIGLQIHGGQSIMDVRFKNMAILQACMQGPNADQNLPQWVAGTSDKHPAVYEHNAALCVAVAGCTDPVAGNTTSGATSDNGSCTYAGCGNPAATNYFCTTNQTAFACAKSNGYDDTDITGVACNVGVVIQGINSSNISFEGGSSFISVKTTNGVKDFGISIFDVKGNLVEGKSGFGASDLQFELNPGIYFVKVKGDGVDHKLTRVNLF